MPEPGQAGARSAGRAVRPPAAAIWHQRTHCVRHDAQNGADRSTQDGSPQHQPRAARVEQGLGQGTGQGTGEQARACPRAQQPPTVHPVGTEAGSRPVETGRDDAT